MAFEFRLPDIGEGVVEGEIVSWKVAEGDSIDLDQPMVEVMTDKATVEIPSPRRGKVAKILVEEGAVCAVGDVMIVIDDGSAGAQAPGRTGKSGHNGNGAGAPAPAAAAPAVHKTAAPAAAPAGEPAGDARRVLATPATRKLARELGVDITRVTPTGKRGRVTSSDVRRHKESGGAPAPARGPQVDRTPVSIAPGGDEERVPFRGLRKQIAQNMVRSKFTATHFTYVEEVDVTELVGVRERAKARAEERGVKLTFLPFIIKAAVSGLKKWKSINASLDESTQEIVYKRYYHLGIATQGPHGLSVGVVRDADRRSIFDIAAEIERVSAAIRDGKATREDLTGSTFTITSLGKLGGVLATPIINFPESAIMGVHKIAERPVVVGGEIAIRHMMNLSISVDHRIADGWDGAMFLQEVKTYLEDPTLMFLEMV